MSIGLNIGSFRWFLNGIVPMEGRTAYTSVWYAGAGLAGGLAPFLAGWLLRSFAHVRWLIAGVGIGPFTLLFVATSAMMALSILFYGLVPAEGDTRTRDYVHALLTRDLPRALAGIPALVRGWRVLRARR
jgi:MFS family permease